MNPFYWLKVIGDTVFFPITDFEEPTKTSLEQLVSCGWIQKFEHHEIGSVYRCTLPGLHLCLLMEHHEDRLNI